LGAVVFLGDPKMVWGASRELNALYRFKFPVYNPVCANASKRSLKLLECAAIGIVLIN
jgi:hypothetical protein